MALKIDNVQMEAIRQHGARDYPGECCGVMLGKTNGVCKEVVEIVPLKNLRNDPARAQELLPVDEPGRETERNRFLIDPLDQLRVEKDARARGLEVLGYYHSHPDHPARPSDIRPRTCLALVFLCYRVCGPGHCKGLNVLGFGREPGDVSPGGI